VNRPPAFQFYPKDWLDFKVMRMSYEAQGVYIRILCHMWIDSRDQCSIMNDDKAIAGMLGISTKKWQVIKKEIQYDGDSLLRKRGKKLVSNRLKKEAKKLQNFHRSQREKGKKSAESQFLRRTTAQPRLNNGSTTAQPEDNPLSSSSSSTTLNNKDKILTNLLIEQIRQNDPKAKAPEKDSSLYVKWVDQIRLCREQDKRSESEIEVAIRFSQEDDFWKGNILSTAKLRKQMPTLLLQTQRFKPDEIGKAPPREKSPEENKRLDLIEKRRSELIAKHKFDLGNADTLEKKEAIQALITTQVATYSRQLEGEK